MTYRQTYRQTDRQTYIHTDRQTEPKYDIDYSFTQSTNMNSPFLYTLDIQRLRERFQIHGLLTMKLEMHGE